MTVQEFFDKYNGQGIDFDGFYGFQCMDLAEQYNQDVVGAPKIGGNAIDAFTTYPTDFYDKVQNTPTGVPQLGDIVVWGAMQGDPYGHIAVFKEGDANQFTSFDQNWPINSTCHFQQHNYNFVLGWLHPKKDVTKVPLTGLDAEVGYKSNFEGQTVTVNGKTYKSFLQNGQLVWVVQLPQDPTPPVQPTPNPVETPTTPSQTVPTPPSAPKQPSKKSFIQRFIEFILSFLQ